MDNEEWAELKRKQRLADSVQQIQREIDEHKKSPLYRTGKRVESQQQPEQLSKEKEPSKQERLIHAYKDIPTQTILTERARLEGDLQALHDKIFALEQLARPLQVRIDEFDDVLAYRCREVVLCEIDEKAAKLMLPALKAMGKDVFLRYAESKIKPCKIIERVTT